jgi:CubicO group peptidase (beta-lactamase class C family)
MNSGLWTAGPGNRTDEVYVGGALVAQTAATMPLEHAPGSHFNYSNNDIMLAGMALSRTLAKDGGRHAALAFPFTELLWPLGMTRTTPETDWQGDFVLSSQVWMTARDLARLALVYQNGGQAGGQQLLPPDWPAFLLRRSKLVHRLIIYLFAKSLVLKIKTATLSYGATHIFKCVFVYFYTLNRVKNLTGQ